MIKWSALTLMCVVVCLTIFLGYTQYIEAYAQVYGCKCNRSTGIK